jgi:hypothetical protein
VSGCIDPIEVKIQRPMPWAVLQYLIQVGPASVKQILDDMPPVPGKRSVHQSDVSQALKVLKECGMVKMEISRQRETIHLYHVVSVAPLQAIIDKLVPVVKAVAA